MNKKYFKWLFFLIIFFSFEFTCAENSFNYEGNKINRVGFIRIPYSYVLGIAFTDLINVKSEFKNTQKQLHFEISGIRKNNFDEKCFLPFITEMKNLDIVGSVECVQNSKNENEIFLNINFADKNLFLRWYKVPNNNVLRVEIFTEESLEKLKYDVSNNLGNQKFKKLLIDPGHGGNLPGACYFDVKEKNLNLAIAQDLQELLELNGYGAIMTRSSDVDVSLPARVELAQKVMADCFISIHCNASGELNPKVKGLEVYYAEVPKISQLNSFQGGYQFLGMSQSLDVLNMIDKHTQNKVERSKSLADKVRVSILHTLKENGFNTLDRGIKNSPLSVLINNSVPAILIECGYMSCKEELDNLVNRVYQQKIAEGIAEAL